MAAYDIFYENQQPGFASELLVNNANRLLKWLYKKYEFDKKEQVNILEIGPGKGYFHAAVKRGKFGDYYAMDRNYKMLEALGIEKERCIEATLPAIPIEKKFDIIFLGYVIEHLDNGIQLYASLENLKQHLSAEGVIVLQFPDCMKLGMEFYNIDYTHTFPTTKRNVNQAVLDCGMYVDKSVDISGILYTRIVDSRCLYFFKRISVLLYSYRIINAVSKVFYHAPIWDLQNVFWRAYALIKEPNAMFVLKVRK